jgi:rhodanese-related sulfurtransferase
MITALTTKYKRNLAPAELRSLLAQADRLQIVDVREQVEFANGHISGARLLPLGELDRRVAELDRSRPVVCVCASGKRSAQAMEKLAALGFNEVHQLDGGLMAWKQARFPLEKDERAPWALERQIRFAAGLLVLAGLGLSLVWPAAIGLSWFVATGAGIRGCDGLVRNGAAAGQNAVEQADARRRHKLSGVTLNVIMEQI